ncbi:hypothetical protein LOAG_12417 [Loa loa]|uniref:Sushi domain-containing protein n=2 Tax=Loa loa TaxID=7209 RepID=A0A1S0TL62_LOALO|nr:hypothetical protein LOAG_12417 [Loa loa]EFO16090.2 hypothetical protein LOAG_12417 [Loa loa]
MSYFLFKENNKMLKLQAVKSPKSNKLVSLFVLIELQEITAMFCPPIEPKTNGEISYLPFTLPPIIGTGTMALLKCNENYIAVGSVTSFCQSNSSWNVNIGKCVRLDFGKPCSHIKGFPGIIHYITPDTIKLAENKLVSGTKAFYICDPGYALKGQSLSICFDGKWSSPPAKCLSVWSGHFLSNEKKCEGIKVDNGTVIYNEEADASSKYNINTIATVRCDPDYVYSGSIQHVCRGYNDWSGRFGVCLPG